MKLLRRDVKSSKDGRAESGVCRSVLVVRAMLWRSDGNGPVTVGYTPVQYDTVVEISGDGNTKLIAVSPYAITFVVRPRAWKDILPLRALVNDAVLVVACETLEAPVDPNVTEIEA